MMLTASLLLYLNELKNPHRKLSVQIRAFNDGLAFRYIFPDQKEILCLLKQEFTCFRLLAIPNVHALVLPDYHSSHEGNYLHRLFRQSAERQPDRYACSVGISGQYLYGNYGSCLVGLCRNVSDQIRIRFMFKSFSVAWKFRYAVKAVLAARKSLACDINQQRTGTISGIEPDHRSCTALQIK